MIIFFSSIKSIFL